MQRGADQGGSEHDTKCPATSQYTTSEYPWDLNQSNIWAHNLPRLPFQIATRKRNAVDEKRRLVLALTAGVTPEGQRLFMAISKTIGPQVTWQGSDICVFGDTFVTHPYRPENVRGSSDRRVIYVKKLVESQWKDVAPAAATPDAKTIGSTSNSTQPAAPTSNGAANVAASINSSAVSSSSSSNASSTVTATSSNNNQSTSAASAN